MHSLRACLCTKKKKSTFYETGNHTCIYLSSAYIITSIIPVALDKTVDLYSEGQIGQENPHPTSQREDWTCLRAVVWVREFVITVLGLISWTTVGLFSILASSLIPNK